MTVKYTADMDPLEEILAIKKEIYQKFKTAAAYDEYLKKKYPCGANPEKLVKLEDIVFEPPMPDSPPKEEEEAYAPPTYHPDMDPLEEIRAIKREISQKFKTSGEYGEYLRKKYPNGANPEKFVRPEKSASEPLTPRRRPAKRTTKRGTMSAQPHPASR